MNRSNYKRILSYLFLFPFLIGINTLSGFSQRDFKPPKYNFTNYSIKDGLSQQIVRSICQDSRGFLWFATEDGLNRFDGYDFINYYFDRTNNKSLPDNFLYTLEPASDGGLWIGTNSHGVAKFNHLTNTFSSLTDEIDEDSDLTDARVYAIYEDNEQNLWVGTFNRGLFYYNTKTKLLSSFKNEPHSESTLPSNTIFSIGADNSGKIWFRTDRHLASFDKKTNTFISKPLPGTLINADFTNNLIIDARDILWTSTEQGLVKYNIKKDDLEIIPLYNDNGKVIEIIEIIEQNTDYLWFGSYSGLYLYDKETGKSLNYKKISNEKNSLSQDVIISMHIDNTGSLWAGTGSSGISKLNLYTKNFQHYSYHPESRNTISGNLIRALYVDSNNNIWVGHVSGAIDIIFRDSQKILPIKKQAGDKTEGVLGFPTSIMERKNGEIWVATWGEGILIYNLDGKLIKQLRAIFMSGDSKDLDLIIHCIREDRFGNIWIGTETGLVLYDPLRKRTRKFAHDPDNNNSITAFGVQSNSIHFDKYGNIWVGTWGGLSRFMPYSLTENSFDIEYKITQYLNESNNPNSLGDNRVISMWYHEKSNPNELLVGTYGGGLNRIIFDSYNPDSLKVFVYGRSEGLSNSVIYTIECDSEGNIWLGTNRGLSKIEPKTGNVSNYFENDGLQSDQFYWGASSISNNGELLFGGVNGFNLFDPKDIVEDTIRPELVFTDFKIFNKSININEKIDGNVILNADINNTEKIRLDYNSKVISFEFAALHYVYPQDNRYKYMLEGFDNDWIEVGGNKRSATYTNLEPGNYTLKVKASNYDGAWTQKTKSIQINIVPPVWRTKWFIATSIILVLLLLVLFFRYRTKQIIRMNRMLEKRVRFRTNELSEKNNQLIKQAEQLNNANITLKEKQQQVQEQAETLFKQRNELEKANQIKDKLFSIIGHDLRNPINNAKGYVDLLKYRYKQYDDEKKKTIISSLSNAIESTYNLLITLLNWSGNEHGQVLFEPNPYIINDVIAENIELVEKTAKRKKIQLINNTKECSINVELDRNLMDTVLSNLLSNAIKYSHSGGKIIIDCKKHKNGVVIGIHDSGIGISKEKLEQILNSDFIFSTHGTSRETGIGLGFAISKNYIEKHEGKIWIKSNAEKGSSVYIELPLKQASSS
jgi:ligand-binding sensor domain-containing protein/signal transduction histidine kinase